MTSIRAPWGTRKPRDGRNGFDALPGLDGLNGKDGRDGERGERGLPGRVLRAPMPVERELPPIEPWHAAYQREDETRLTKRVLAGPMDSAPVVELVVFRDDFDDIAYVDILPIGAT